MEKHTSAHHTEGGGKNSEVESGKEVQRNGNLTANKEVNKDDTDTHRSTSNKGSEEEKEEDDDDDDDKRNIIIGPTTTTTSTKGEGEARNDDKITLLQPGMRDEDGIRILEGLAASGLRSIRYAREVGGVKEVVANDISRQALECMKRNIEHNGVGHLVKPSLNDAR